MTHPDPDTRLTPEDGQLVEKIARAYEPAPMSPARQATFRRAVEARLGWRARCLPLPVFAVAATAAVALVFWIGLPRRVTPDGAATVVRRVAQDLTLYTFVEANAGSDDFLPDDYLVLANALDLPIDDF